MQLCLQVLIRPGTAEIFRPAKNAGHQDDTAVDYIKSLVVMCV